MVPVFIAKGSRIDVFLSEEIQKQKEMTAVFH